MRHYASTIRINASYIYDAFSGSSLLGREPFVDLDESTDRTMLVEVAKGPVAEPLTRTPRNPPRSDPSTGWMFLGASPALQLYMVEVPFAGSCMRQRALGVSTAAPWQQIDVPE